MVRRAYAVASSPVKASATACGASELGDRCRGGLGRGSPVAMRSLGGVVEAVAQFGEDLRRGAGVARAAVRRGLGKVRVELVASTGTGWSGGRWPWSPRRGGR